MGISFGKVLGAAVLAAGVAVLSMAWPGMARVQEPSDLQTLHLPSLLASAAEAAKGADMFLKIEGVEGESSDEAHKNEIQIESFSWGATQTGTYGSGGGGGAGKVSMQDFHFTMQTSKASPELMLAVATGKHFPKAVLTVRKAGKDQLEYLTWTFSDILVSSYQTGMDGGADVPTEQLSLNFAKIEVKYVPQMADGKPGRPVTACWDVQKNSRC